jgi:hypothetical protein
MDANAIHDLADRLIDTRRAAAEAEQNARVMWDRAGAISTRLREALCGNHHLVVLHDRAKALIIEDEDVRIEDIVVLDRASAETPTAVAPPATPAADPATDPVPTRAQLRDLCREAAKTLGAEAVRAALGGKVDAIPEAEIATKAQVIRQAMSRHGAA